MFCFHCLRARQRAMFMSHCKLYEPAFIDSGFCDWQNAIRAFETHEKCDCHREAVASLQSISRVCVSARLDTQLARDQQVAFKALSVVIGSVPGSARSVRPRSRGHSWKRGPCVVVDKFDGTSMKLS